VRRAFGDIRHSCRDIVENMIRSAAAHSIAGQARTAIRASRSLAVPGARHGS
jgi:hypothetical protein